MMRGLAAAIALLLVSGEAMAQASPSAYTTGTRYDAEGKVTGTIAPDPDGAGPLKHAAVRNTYDLAGRLTRVEQGELSVWKSESVAPSTWVSPTEFKILKVVDTVYDPLDRKLVEKVSSGGTIHTVTQYSYDLVGRLECAAVRMNPAAFASLPASACTPGAVSPDYRGDRITRNIYDAAGQLLQVREGVGSGIEAAEVTYSYTPTGKREFVIDGEGNKAQLTYDGHDRQARWIFPSTTRPTSFDGSTQANALASAGSVNAADYEEYGYDDNGNRTSLRKRDASTLTYSFDNLNRMTVKVVPERANLAAAQTRDVYYDYDLRGLMLKARFDSLSGDGVTSTYNGFGDLTYSTITMGAFSKTLSSIYDKESHRTRLTHPDGAYFTIGHDGLNRMNLASWTIGGQTTQFMAIAFENSGLRSNINRASSWTQYGYDPIGRLAWMPQDFVGTANDVTQTFAYNPASQIVGETRDNDAYAWTGAVAVNRPYTTNGLNQYTAAGPASFAYDANGNLTGEPGVAYVYDIENRLASASGSKTASLVYDPMGRLFETSGGTPGITRFLYDGDSLALEYDGNETIKWRYFFGPNVDEPILADPGGQLACTNGTRFLHSNQQGSIIALADCWGNRQEVNRYDEYGVPQMDAAFQNNLNTGRFQYTGQAWLPELGMYHYKARIYSPTLGRFLQVDPIGYDDQVNLYAYVGDDPINKSDPTGLSCDSKGENCKIDNPGKMTSMQQAKATKAYQKAVDKLMKNPDKKVTLRAESKTGTRIQQSTSTTQGEMAKGLKEANVSFESQPTDKSGNEVDVRAQAGGIAGDSSKAPYMQIFPHFFTDYSKAITSHERLTRSFIHESGHMTAAGNALRDSYLGNFSRDHYNPWSIMSKDIYDGR